jgi:hypothetical protein
MKSSKNKDEVLAQYTKTIVDAGHCIRNIKLIWLFLIPVFMTSLAAYYKNYHLFGLLILAAALFSAITTTIRFRVKSNDILNMPVDPLFISYLSSDIKEDTPQFNDEFQGILNGQGYLTNGQILSFLHYVERETKQN